jgi:hypothetical protein
MNEERCGDEEGGGDSGEGSQVAPALQENPDDAAVETPMPTRATDTLQSSSASKKLEEEFEKETPDDNGGDKNKGAKNNDDEMVEAENNDDEMVEADDGTGGAKDDEEMVEADADEAANHINVLFAHNGHGPYFTRKLSLDDTLESVETKIIHGEGAVPGTKDANGGWHPSGYPPEEWDYEGLVFLKRGDVTHHPDSYLFGAYEGTPALFTPPKDLTCCLPKNKPLSELGFIENEFLVVFLILTNKDGKDWFHHYITLKQSNGKSEANDPGKAKSDSKDTKSEDEENIDKDARDGDPWESPG